MLVPSPTALARGAAAVFVLGGTRAAAQAPAQPAGLAPPAPAAAAAPPGDSATVVRQRTRAEGAARGAWRGARYPALATLVALPFAIAEDRRRIVGMGTGFVLMFGTVYTAAGAIAGAVVGSRAPGTVRVPRPAPAAAPPDAAGAAPPGGAAFLLAPARRGAAAGVRLAFR